MGLFVRLHRMFGKTSLEGKTALVTGASSGLGVDFAKQLAAMGARVIVVARREQLLQQLSVDIQDEFGTPAEYRCCDLSDAGAREALAADLTSAGIHIDILINNAGFGLFGDFRHTEWQRTDQMLQLDIVALTHLTRLFVNPMVENGYGRIMQISSVGAFQPSPGYGAYSAAKAYVLSFSHALHYELKDTGVTSTVVCPGVTETEFLRVSGQARNRFHNATMMSSREVARMALKRTLKGRPEIVTGLINAINAFQVRFMPRQLLARIAAMAMKYEAQNDS